MQRKMNRVEGRECIKFFWALADGKQIRIDGPHSWVQRIGEPHDCKFFYDHLRSVSLELNN